MLALLLFPVIQKQFEGSGLDCDSRLWSSVLSIISVAAWPLGRPKNHQPDPLFFCSLSCPSAFCSMSGFVDVSLPTL